MGFQVSPGVNVTEIDLTTVVPAVSSTEGALAGPFNWGPAEQRVLVDSEVTLVSRFGKPTSDNAETFFTAANFLSYGNKLYVVRTVDGTSRNAVAGNSVSTGVLIKNQDDFENGVTSDALVAARYVGTLGNSLKVEICDSANAYSSNVSIAGTANNDVVDASELLSLLSFTVGSNVATLEVTAANTSVNNESLSTELNTVAATISIGDVIKVGNSSIGEQYLEVTALSSNGDSDTYSGNSTTANTASRTVNFKSRYTLSTNFSTGVVQRLWKHQNLVDSAPGTSGFVAARGGEGDLLHVIVSDEDGSITGLPGTVLEKYEALSRATDAKNESGESVYYLDVINQQSDYVYIVNESSPTYSNTAANMTALSSSAPLAYSLTGGVDAASESALALADYAVGYDMFSDPADVDISLVLSGRTTGGTHGEGLFNYIIDNVCETRKDCVAFGSPEKADVVNTDSAADNIVEFRNAVRSTSYAVLDSGYKYQYDKYNDVYRWIPLNGDIAGLVVRTDDVRDPWFSPGGFNRGQIKNVVKLAYNPRKAYRDVLYKAGVNPVVTFPGQGTVLFGDKTLLAQPSAFDRINVRRLFIVLEKAISTAAKFTLFEFNDEFTRAQFVNLVEPFLRDVQGRRGIYDFRVVCDESNNTGEVIDRNEFVGDIYIKPARSINFIQLNFVAVRTGVEFSEVVGQF